MRWLALLVLLLVLAGCSRSGPSTQGFDPFGSPNLPQPAGTPAWKQHAARAEEHLAKKEYAQVITEATEAIKRNPDSADLYALRAMAYRFNNQPDLTLADCDKALTLQPGHPRALLQRAFALRDRGAYDQAIADLNKLIDRGVDVLEDAIPLRGECHYRRGELVKALDDLDTALKLKPEDAPVLALRGQVQLDLGNLDVAVTDFTKSLKIDSGQVLALRGRSEAQARLRKYTEALADADEAVRLAPTNAAAHDAQGLAYYGLRDYDKAIAAYNQAVKLAPDNADFLADRARCQADWHFYESALPDLNKAIELRPKHASFYTDRGKLWLATRAYDKALADFNKAAELDTGLIEAWLGRGEALRRLDKDEAVPALVKAVELAGANLRDRPLDDEVRLLRARSFQLLGMYFEAVADYEQVLQLYPLCIDAYRELAWIRATCAVRRFRNGPQAIDLAKKACQLTDWKDAECLDTLAAAYAQARQFAEAERWAKDAVARAWQEFRPEATQRAALYAAQQSFLSK
jgi:tetratricopeptide (TPR) repeat protein